MARSEGIGERLRQAIQRLGLETKRVADLTHAKIELNRLQEVLKEREGVLGKRLLQLKRRGAVKDKFILEALKEEFEALADCERQIEAALADIHGLAAIEPPAWLSHAVSKGSGEDEPPSALDSFEVS